MSNLFTAVSAEQQEIVVGGSRSTRKLSTDKKVNVAINVSPVFIIQTGGKNNVAVINYINGLN